MNASPDQPASPHPDFQSLVEFAFGKLDSDQLQQIANHLENCPPCCALLTGAKHSDLLLEKLRTLPRQDSSYSPEVVRSVALAMARQDSIPGASLPPTRRLDSEPVEWINQYQLEAEVGRGGMGVVYKAVDVVLHRPVALKMMLAGPFASSVARVRFRQEAELAVRVRDHRVVQVYEIGEFHGNPFVAFEWIEGGSLADVRRSRIFTPIQAAELIEEIARAVHLAHTQGVIHRDLKPANILLTPDGKPKIADFGLARLYDQRPGLTISGSLMGTPHYMAPEQAVGDSKSVGPCSDIYSLGAILYELLSGRPPLQANSTAEALRLIMQQDPTSIRTSVASCPVDLDVIALKCLSKKPTDRYHSAQDLADDLRRFLSGLPITARPIGPVKKIRLWCKRNPTIASLVAMVIASLTAGVIVSSGFAYRAYQEAARSQSDARAARDSELLANQMTELAQIAERKARANAYDANALLLQNAWEDKEVERFLKVLAKLEPVEGQEDLRGFEWHYWNTRFQTTSEKVSTGHGFVTSAIFNRDGSKIAFADIDGNVTLIDAVSRAVEFTIHAHHSQLNQLCFVEHDSKLACAGEDGQIKILDANDGHEILALPGHSLSIRRLKEVSTGLLSRSEDGTVRLWSLESGQELQRFDSQSIGIGDMDVNPSQTRLLTSSGLGALDLWDLTTHQRIAQWHIGESIPGLAFSPDGQSVAICGHAGLCGVLDAETGKPRFPLMHSLHSQWEVRFHPSGQSFYVAGNDSVVRHFQADTGVELEPLIGHVGNITSVVCHPTEPDTLLTSGADGIVRRWNPHFRPNPLVHQQAYIRPHQFGFDSSGSYLAIPTQGGAIDYLDLRARASKVLNASDAGELVHAVICSQKGDRVFAATIENELGVWNVDSAARHTRQFPQTIYCLALNSAEDRLALGCADGSIHICDTTTLESITVLSRHQGNVIDVQFADDGKLLYSSGFDGALNLWDCATWTHDKTLVQHETKFFKLALAPHNDNLAVASEDGTVHIRDRKNGQLLDVLRGHGGPVRSVCYSPDGRRLATGGYDRTVRVWDTETGQEVLTFSNHAGDVMDVQFSPTGKYLASLANGGEVRVWHSE